MSPNTSHFRATDSKLELIARYLLQAGMAKTHRIPYAADHFPQKSH